MPSDLEQLVDMGFEKERAEFAVKQSGGLQGAIDWLEKNQDKSIEEIKEEQSEQPPELKPGEEARSLKCDDCGKKFRSPAQAEFHASKTYVANLPQQCNRSQPIAFIRLSTGDLN